MVHTLVRHSRLLVALTSGCLVLAMAVPVASSAFLYSVTPSGGTNSLVATAAIDCDQNPPAHDSCRWAGNEATGPRGTYRAASVEFRVPSISGNLNDRISFWAGVGGDQPYAGTCKTCVVLVQAGVDSEIVRKSQTQLMQHNFAWYEIASPTGSQTPVNFSSADSLKPGHMIKITVSSNLHGDQDNEFSITDEYTHESHGWTISGPLSDSATGECMGERITSQLLGALPIANFGTEWLNNCTITTDQASHPVGPYNGWPSTDWYHIVNTSGVVLVGIGGVDSNGSFPLDWNHAA